MIKCYFPCFDPDGPYELEYAYLFKCPKQSCLHCYVPFKPFPTEIVIKFKNEYYFCGLVYIEPYINNVLKWYKEGMNI
jgi:hypothetical protein